MNLKLIYLIYIVFYFHAGDVVARGSFDPAINPDHRSSHKTGRGEVYMAQFYSLVNLFKII